MYVALRETFDVYPDNKAVRRFAGDRLETFSSWPIQNQMAALSARIVREVPDEGLPAEQMFARQDRAVVEDAKNRARETAAELMSKPVSTKVSVDPASVGHDCGDCDYVGATARGLAIHRGSAHKAP